ncbi:MAG: hypothetical protein LBV51_00090 [Acholeplasmatales bacterium]|jgi:hypothetical protein|nr:hypothetical protein [Acholeplasmatales bacterium]
MQAVMETIFETSYLLGSLVIGIIVLLFLKKIKNKKPVIIFGIMILILTIGDSFHLIPRMYSLITDSFEENKAALGIGTLVTSITMTIYYVMFYHFIQINKQKQYPIYLTIIIYVLALARIIICALPQNDWAGDGNYLFGIIRNIPFLLLGAVIIALLIKEYFLNTHNKYFKYSFIFVILSFIFYTIVFIGVDMIPILGLMMLPKTVCYVVITVMGLKYSKSLILEETTLIQS